MKSKNLINKTWTHDMLHIRTKQLEMCGGMDWMLDFQGGDFRSISVIILILSYF